jgi:hypothetical protein
VAVEVRRSIPLRSAGWKRSSQGTGTKTQFSGLGKTPTGELKELGCALIFICDKRKMPIVCPPEVCLYTCLLAFFNTRVQSYVDCLVRCRFLRVEILDESRVGI